MAKFSVWCSWNRHGSAFTFYRINRRLAVARNGEAAVCGDVKRILQKHKYNLTFTSSTISNKKLFQPT